jgi:hypothetical protein
MKLRVLAVYAEHPEVVVLRDLTLVIIGVVAYPQAPILSSLGTPSFD